MKLKYFHFLPFFSFLKKFEPNSIIFKIIKAFFISILLTNCIYLSSFKGDFIELISPLLSIWGLFLLLRFKNKMGYFLSGFFTGILWLWWLGLSSIYFNLTFLVPFIILLIGLIYALLFLACYFLKYDLLRLAGIFALSYIHILGFNWFDWEILSVLGSFEAGLRGTICIFLIAYFLHEGWISLYYKMAIILALFVIGAQFEQKKAPYLAQNIALIQTNISQDLKFQRENISINSYKMIELIRQAKEAKKSLIILPESSFAFALNKNPSYKAELLKLSNDIDIIAGAFRADANMVFNTSYFFSKGQVFTFDKLKLVPFGEELPILKDFVRENFLPNMREFSKASKISTYFLGGQKVVNAICYEATYPSFYKDAKIMIALSNNAWFPNSSEFLLQDLLIRLNASVYGVRVYHSVNGLGGGMVGPKVVLLQKLYKRLKKLLSKKISIKISDA